MLVLSRYPKQSIVINNSIHITVLEVSGDKVRLGIDAPKDVVVNRLEVQRKLNEDQNTQPEQTD